MKKSKRKKRVKIVCFFIAVLITSLCLYFSSNKILEDLALKSFDSTISCASYHAIDQILSEGYDYKSLLDVSTDSSGNINMIITDSFKVNSMASSIATYTYNYLTKQTNLGVDVPIGAFTGIRLLGGFGKAVKMKLISVSSVKCEIVSSMMQAGINQTRHTLTLNIVSNVSLITKTSTKAVSDKISVLVYDNLIIGKVPQIYLNSQVIGSADEK